MTSPRHADSAYAAIEQVEFAGMQYRRDIAWRAPGAGLTSYAAAGVDIGEGNRAVAEMRHAVERTHGAEVIRGVGSFGGAFSAKAIAAMDDPCSSPRPTGSARRSSWQRASDVSVDWATTSSTTASATCSCSRPARCSSSTTWRRASSMPTSSPRWSAGWPRLATRPGARCSAVRRPRCPASTPTVRSTSPARSSASPNGIRYSPVPTSSPAMC